MKEEKLSVFRVAVQNKKDVVYRTTRADYTRFYCCCLITYINLLTFKVSVGKIGGCFELLQLICSNA